MVVYAGDILSRYDVSLSSGAAKLSGVTNPRMFATRYRTPQLKFCALEDALGEGRGINVVALWRPPCAVPLDPRADD